MWADLIYVGAVAPLVIAGFVAVAVWRSAATQRTRRALQEGLASDNPDVRRNTLEALDEETLSGNATALLALLGTEQDPEVLDALAGAVARSRWEPTDDGNIVELRRWVAGRHAHRAAATIGDPSGRSPGQTAQQADVAASTSPGAIPGVPGDIGADPSGRAASPRRAPTAPMVEESSHGETDLSELVPKVRALLGERLARMELVSIDGEVLAKWSSTDPQPENA